MFSETMQEGKAVMTEYVTLDGYVVKRISPSGKAAGIVKTGMELSNDITWVPLSCVRDGEALSAGDTDIEVAKWLADREGLDH
jgi:hypothetical protein